MKSYLSIYLVNYKMSELDLFPSNSAPWYYVKVGYYYRILIHFFYSSGTAAIAMCWAPGAIAPILHFCSTSLSWKWPCVEKPRKPSVEKCWKPWKKLSLWKCKKEKVNQCGKKFKWNFGKCDSCKLIWRRILADCGMPVGGIIGNSPRIYQFLLEIHQLWSFNSSS